VKAIPTTYNGVRFRSRLEAKWAAFFDLAGWRWEYEPLDLDGYVPDFILQMRRPILVEVKPFMWDFVNEDEQNLIGHARVKIDLSGWDGEAWIVGATTTKRGDADWLCGQYREDGAWGNAGLYACGECGHKTPFHHDMSWRCRQCGADDHASHRIQNWDVTADLRAAANAVQWRAA